MISFAQLRPPKPNAIAKAKPMDPKKMLTILVIKVSPMPICVKEMATVKNPML